MYESVQKFFQEKHPDLVRMLNNTGAFWPAIKDNTIPNATLEQNIYIGMRSMNMGAVFHASLALAIARLVGNITNPG